ncbi:hypothetical protein ACE09Y_07905 [Raphidiopsis sp. BLCC-F218]
MKCVNCGTDNKLRDRKESNGRCKQCHHQFTFEPTDMGAFKITDAMFSKTLADISVNYTLHFTNKQFLYFLDSRLKKKAFKSTGFWIMYFFLNIFLAPIFGIVGSLISQVLFVTYLFLVSQPNKLNSFTRRNSAKRLVFVGVFILIFSTLLWWSSYNVNFIFYSFTFLGILSVSLGILQLVRIKNSRDLGYDSQDFLITQLNVNDWLARWQLFNGKVDKILPETPTEIEAVSISPEITAYSFDRLVVCDSPSIAQVLIANNFHFEHNCAILAMNGYPENIFGITMEMLKRNPNLQVFALHDCSPEGVSLVNYIRTNENWFLNSQLPIIDIGLLPRQILGNKGRMFIRKTATSAEKSKNLPLEIRQTLSAQELAWLDAGNFIELESFSPQILIQVIRNAISRSFDLVADSNGLLVISDPVNYVDTNNSIYMIESFG